MTSLSISPKIPEGILTQGQGEYVVFQIAPDGTRKTIDPPLFSRCYEIFSEHTPAKLLAKGLLSEAHERYKQVVSKVQELQPSLQLFFVPKTFYELIAIHKLIREDLKHNALCPKQMYLAGLIRNRLMLNHPSYSRNCLHCPPLETDKSSAPSEFIGTAYRINNSLIKKASESPLGFTFSELLAHTDKEIEFLEKFSSSPTSKNEESIKEIFNNSAISSLTTGPTSIFLPNEKAQYSLTFDTPHPTTVIRKSLELDCSEIGAHSIILYRGGNLSKDLTLSSHSTSFGTSLFAGIVYDSGATAFCHMCEKETEEERDAYAIFLPFEEALHSAMYIPTGNTVEQLFSRGEFFHPRTKICKKADMPSSLTTVKGISWSAVDTDSELFKYIIPHLLTELSEEELSIQLRRAKERTILLETILPS